MAGIMSKPIEGFIHTMRVGWADCDPARIAFTGRIPYWALEAIDAWWERVTGLDWFAMNVDRQVGTPFVHMTLDFRSPVTPRHRLDCAVELLRLGSKSIRHRVIGRQAGILCFEGEFVSAFVDTKTFQSRNPPEDLVRLLTQE
jgi:4-hydroxybenzoyl-CoA thioesterase